MSREDELAQTMTQYRAWTQTADRGEDGWESDFPDWARLMALCNALMHEQPLKPETLDMLAECWDASFESGEPADYAVEHIGTVWTTVAQLGRSERPLCRATVCTVAGFAGAKAEAFLRESLGDSDEYVRRMALLALAKLEPADAQALAEPLLRDPSVYTRTAAIDMVMAAKDADFRHRALTQLADDPEAPVRTAANEALQRLLLSQR